MKKINSLCWMIALGLLAEGQALAAPDLNRGMDAGTDRTGPPGYGTGTGEGTNCGG